MNKVLLGAGCISSPFILVVWAVMAAGAAFASCAGWTSQTSGVTSDGVAAALPSGPTPDLPHCEPKKDVVDDANNAVSGTDTPVEVILAMACISSHDGLRIIRPDDVHDKGPAGYILVMRKWWEDTMGLYKDDMTDRATSFNTVAQELSNDGVKDDLKKALLTFYDAQNLPKGVENVLVNGIVLMVNGQLVPACAPSDQLTKDASTAVAGTKVQSRLLLAMTCAGSHDGTDLISPSQVDANQPAGYVLVMQDWFKKTASTVGGATPDMTDPAAELPVLVPALTSAGCVGNALTPDQLTACLNQFFGAQKGYPSDIQKQQVGWIVQMMAGSAALIQDPAAPPLPQRIGADGKPAGPMPLPLAWNDREADPNRGCAPYNDPTAAKAAGHPCKWVPLFQGAPGGALGFMEQNGQFADPGQCTWWASYNFPVKWTHGNAKDWYGIAAGMGYTVTPAGAGQRPHVGALAIFKHDPAGHVAVVVDVEQNSFTMSEMNVSYGGQQGNGLWQVDWMSKLYTDSDLTGFIEPPAETFPGS